MSKKNVLLALPFALVLGFSSNISVSAAEDSSSNQTVTVNEKEKYQEELSNLTQEEIISNYERIDQQYAVGEELSLKDQTFIEMYAKKPTTSGITLFASKSISGSTTKDGVTVSVKGTINHDINNLVNQNFSATNVKTSTTKGASKVTSIKTVVHHTAFGLIGSGGVGKVYSGSLSTTGKNSTLNGTKYYTAVVAYATTWCDATVKYDGGSFTVNPN